jgi:hypothetical protein
VLRRLAVLLAVAAAALALAGSAAALTVHVRVEGVTKTIFGAAERELEAFAGAVVADDGSLHELTRPTGLGALEAASREGEFFYRLKSFSFGLFVDWVGRYPAQGTSGWVYKVNGVSPPVGAADYVLEDGDRVLWYHAEFGPEGGPKSLELVARPGGCFQAVLQDDAGKSTPAGDVIFLVDGRRVRSASGESCPTGQWRRLRATKAGAIRSRVVLG